MVIKAKTDLWKAISDSPFMMVSLDNQPNPSEPMTAQLDPQADGEFWFFTKRDNRLAKGGAAMAHFSAMDHELFACLRGNLVEETDDDVIDQHWSKQVEAWYPEGRLDSNLLMLRFELEDAEIWQATDTNTGIMKLLTGESAISQGKEHHHHVQM